MKNHRDCTGCNVCQFVCTNNAIILEQDKDGFWYPKIDKNKCTRCGACDKICDTQDSLKSIHDIVFAQYKNKEILSSATSGGIVSALAENIINEGGCVVSVNYSNVQTGAVWEVVEKIQDLTKIQGSKYFQVPLTKSIYCEIKNRISFQKVLFVGTPCQVSAVNKVVKSNNLITIDIICGGVASGFLEEKYIEYWTKKVANVRLHLFRKKILGWSRDYYAHIEFSDGRVKNFKGFDDLFNYAYNSNNCMRESCYRCPYTKMQRTGDLTVGDAWGVEKEKIPEFEKEQGTSLIIINSEKGKRLFNAGNNIYTHRASENALASNRPLYTCTKKRIMRRFSYKLIRAIPIQMAVRLINYRRTIKNVFERGKV